MTEELFAENAEWEICMGAKQRDDAWSFYATANGGGYVHVDGKPVPCTKIQLDAAPGGPLTVTLTFIPRNLKLSVLQGES